MNNLKIIYLHLFIIMFPFLSCSKSDSTTSPLPITGSALNTIDHTCIHLSQIPIKWIKKAKSDLVIAYGHTSHGSQIISGMNELPAFAGSIYNYNNSGIDSALQLRDNPFQGASDLGNPNRTAWAAASRDYLVNHTEVNIIIWSWCGQVSSASETEIETYLYHMNELEHDFPNVKFIYMTGHLDGSGLTGNLHLRNDQIRSYCRNNNKFLYDFADIETYDPDGAYFGDKIPNDNCDYDSNGDGNRDTNWAIEWQNANPGQWYNCSSAHSQPLNANLKAYAAWWLWARLAEWNGQTE